MFWYFRLNVGRKWNRSGATYKLNLSDQRRAKTQFIKSSKPKEHVTNSPFTNSPMWPTVSTLCLLSFTRHPKRFHPSKHRMRYRCWQSFHQTIDKSALPVNEINKSARRDETSDTITTRKIYNSCLLVTYVDIHFEDHMQRYPGRG